jgi:hypothetical protein
MDDICRSVLAGLVGLFALACAAHAELDSGDSNIRFSGGIESSDAGMLSAGSLIISDFTVQLWEGDLGNEEPHLRLYLKEGFNSPSGAQATSTLVGPLPETFAWTVTFPEVGGFGESSGLDLYNPPAAGGNYLPSWENIGPDGWEPQGNSDGMTPNFPGRIGVVPEPGVLILGLIGGLVVLLVRNRCKRT